MKRILSFVLCVLMLTSVLFVGAAAAEKPPYTDVKTGRWSYADIMYVTEKGLMNGKEEGKFSPAETMTRAMVVTVFYRLAGSPDVEYEPTFTDVKANKWFTDAIIWASANGIVNGTGDGKYEPMASVTREQLATIIMRYAQFDYIKTDKTVDITGYADYKRIHDYAREAMSWANAEGLITGKTESTLAPREGATREQFAAILHRFDTAGFDYELVYNAPVYGQNYVAPEYELVTDADIYVAVDGDDTNPGTLDKPIKTFERARDMVYELKQTKKEGGIKVAFKAGEYGTLDNLTFTPEDAGTAECPITYCKYGDGDVIFRNGLVLPEKDFKPLTDAEKSLFTELAVSSIKKIDLSGKIDVINTTDYIFSGTTVCHEARFPDKNADGTDNHYIDFTTRVEEEGKEEWEYDKLKLTGVAMKVANGFSTYNGLKITGMLRTGWLHDTFSTKGYDKKTGYLTLDYENSAFESGYPLTEYPLAYEDRMDDTIFFHNLPEFLDKENEYWFDIETKQLYIYAPSGDYSIGMGGTFMTIENGADHLTFTGLGFNTTVDTAVICNADYITFTGCTFGNISGHSAIQLTDVTNLLIKDNEFYNFVDNGIDLNNHMLSVRDALIHTNNVITNNYLHDFSLPQYFSQGIQVQHDVGTVISHNILKNGGHSGVDFGCCIYLKIEYNVFDNMMMNTIDSGAVGTWNSICYRDNEIRYNLFCNIRAKGGMYGIYLDSHSSGQKVYGNIFYNAGDVAVAVNSGRDNDVHDNICINTVPNSDFLLYNAGLYGLIQDGTADQYEQSEWWQYYKSQIVNPGEDAYDMWREKWPILYNYNTDPSKVGEPECIFTTVNYIRNNVAIGAPIEYSEYCKLFGVVENNTEYPLSENPFFVDPTHGDYTIVKDAERFTVDIDFNKIGIQ